MLNNLCDLYLPEPVRTKKLAILNYYDKNFIFDTNKLYNGYMNVSINRLAIVYMVSSLRKEDIISYGVPLKYKDVRITREEAFIIATNYINNEFSDGKNRFLKLDYKYGIPLVWHFSIFEEDPDPDIAGWGSVKIDKLDGHIWSEYEYYEYLYDYNNILT